MLFEVSPESVTGTAAQLNLGTPSDAAAGAYSLCWRRAASNDLSSYDVEVGDFKVKGAIAKPVVCMIGTDCVITFDGFEQDTTDHIIIIHNDKACGAAEGVQLVDWTTELQSPMASSTSGLVATSRRALALTVTF